MTLGTILILAYWGFYTVKTGFSLKLTPKINENQHERKLAAGSGDETRIKKAEGLFKVLRVCGGVFRVVGWIENVLLALIAIWLVYLIGAVIAGSFIFLGYPV